MENSDAIESEFKANPYELVSVTPAEAPAGGEGPHWHKYIIQQGSNQITGYSQGGMRKVKSEALGKVEELNIRRYGLKNMPKAIKPKTKAA